MSDSILEAIHSSIRAFALGASSLSLRDMIIGRDAGTLVLPSGKTCDSQFTACPKNDEYPKHKFVTAVTSSVAGSVAP